MALNPTTKKPPIKDQREEAIVLPKKKGKVIFIVTNTGNKTYITKK